MVNLSYPAAYVARVHYFHCIVCQCGSYLHIFNWWNHLYFAVLCGELMGDLSLVPSTSITAAGPPNKIVNPENIVPNAGGAEFKPNAGPNSFVEIDLTNGNTQSATVERITLMPITDGATQVEVILVAANGAEDTRIVAVGSPLSLPQTPVAQIRVRPTGAFDTNVKVELSVHACTEG
jgi:hypothetical protein